MFFEYTNQVLRFPTYLIPKNAVAIAVAKAAAKVNILFIPSHTTGVFLINRPLSIVMVGNI